MAKEMSEFERAFSKARRELGKKGVFTFKGKKYSTAYKEEVPSKKPSVDEDDMAFPSKPEVPKVKVNDRKPILSDVEEDDMAAPIRPGVSKEKNKKSSNLTEILGGADGLGAALLGKKALSQYLNKNLRASLYSNGGKVSDKELMESVDRISKMEASAAKKKMSPIKPAPTPRPRPYNLGTVKKAAGGSVGSPRGCGVAMRGYGKAMKRSK